MIDLTALEAEVSSNESVDQSAITLIESLAAEIESSKGDPVALQALVDRLRASSAALASAISANTPAAPEPVPPPTPEL